MDKTVLIVVNPERTLVLLDNEYLFPGGNGTAQEVAIEWLGLNFDPDSFTFIAEVEDEAITYDLYLLETKDIGAAPNEGLHFVQVDQVQELVRNAKVKTAAWLVPFALNADKDTTVKVTKPNKVKLDKEDFEPYVELPIVQEEPEPEEDGYKKRKGKGKGK